MQPSFVDPYLRTPSSFYGTPAALPDPAPSYDPRAPSRLPDPPTQLEQLQAAYDQVFQQYINTQECAPTNATDVVAGGYDNLLEHIDPASLIASIYQFHYDHVPQPTHQQMAGEYTAGVAAQPLMPSLCEDWSSPLSSVSAPSSSSSTASSPSSSPSTASSPSPVPSSPPSPSAHSSPSTTRGKRGVNQPARNEQLSERSAPRQAAHPSECRYCPLRFGRPADAKRHEITHFDAEHRVTCLGVPVWAANHCDDADIVNGFMHGGTLMVQGCLQTFRGRRRDAYSRHLKTRGCPGNKEASYVVNVQEVEAARARRRANGY